MLPSSFRLDPLPAPCVAPGSHPGLQSSISILPPSSSSLAASREEDHYVAQATQDLGITWEVSRQFRDRAAFRSPSQAKWPAHNDPQGKKPASSLKFNSGMTLDIETQQTNTDVDVPGSARNEFFFRQCFSNRDLKRYSFLHYARSIIIQSSDECCFCNSIQILLKHC